MGSGRRAQNVVASPVNAVRSGQYYGLTCVACRERFAVLNDSTKGDNPVKIVGSGYIHVTCPHCRADRLYELGDLKSLRQS